MKYWLMKSEPEVFSIDNLKTKKTAFWDGVRNYQARNFMQRDMQVGDEVLFYHSSAKPPGVVGVARVVVAAEPDPTQFDAKSEYFDPKATPDKPIWYGVRIGFVEKYPRLIALEELRAQKNLQDLLVLRKGQRLSIQPVQTKEFECITKLARI
jgi:predicted RNA-binding protein with PUA-like domain